MVACREPEEDLKGSESLLFPSEHLQAGTKQDVRGGEFWDDRTRKQLDSEKVRAARAEELRELDRRVWFEADVQECWNKKGRGPMDSLSCHSEPRRNVLRAELADTSGIVSASVSHDCTQLFESCLAQHLSLFRLSFRSPRQASFYEGSQAGHA